MFQAARDERGSGEQPVQHTREPDLFEIEVAVRRVVLLLCRRRPADALEVGAVLVDRDRMLGSYLAVTFQQIQKYEKGINSISAADLARLAVPLQCQLTDFFKSDSPRIGATTEVQV